MKILTTATIAIAAFGFVASVGTAASACEWMKTAKATPVPSEELAAPATEIDPLALATNDVAVVPRAPEEENQAN